jgi:hypothetical protein
MGFIVTPFKLPTIATGTPIATASTAEVEADESIIVEI